MERCTSPGCTGVIEDGYCNVCGLARQAPAEPAAPARPAPSSPTPAGPVVTPVAESRPIAEASPAPPSAAPRPEATPESRADSDQGSGSVESSPSGGTGPSTGAGYGSASGSTSGSVRRGLLGAGLVDVPYVPYRDPGSAVMDNPEVPERHRFCSKCGDPVGREHESVEARTEGFCRNCGQHFSLTPKLAPGDLVGGQYEVLGCLAHGGMGWIYLARDHNVGGRWVVLKGLLDTGDEELRLAAKAERAFLAEIEHPNIVRIYNYVQHEGIGYTVMEYVGGTSLKDLVLQRRNEALPNDKDGSNEGLPLDLAIAYVLEVLRAVGYLHDRGFLYCDFKPDNAIQIEEQLKLIDMGGVRRIDDHDSAIYGTIGYQAPEVADAGPSIGSDLYTVGRALAVLTFRFKGYTSSHVDRLPKQDDVALLKEYDSFDRFLRRATHKEPEQRFQNATEMAEQLTGVLREVLAAQDGHPRPGPSTLFGPELEPAGAQIPDATTPRLIRELDPAEAAAALPAPLVDRNDPAAAFLAGLGALSPEHVVDALATAPVQSTEIRLMLARVLIELQVYDHAIYHLGKIDAPDWRVDWYRALISLSRKEMGAREQFDRLYGRLPGEIAPKLGLAFANELAGTHDSAEQFYETVWRTDNGYVSAAFGLARVRSRRTPEAGLDVLDSVPRRSNKYVAAQLALIWAELQRKRNQALTPDDLTRLAGRLAPLEAGAEVRRRLTAVILEAALPTVRHHRVNGDRLLLGVPFTEKGLRTELERHYRELARAQPDKVLRHRLVERANTVRPRTLI